MEVQPILSSAGIDASRHRDGSLAKQLGLCGRGERALTTPLSWQSGCHRAKWQVAVYRLLLGTARAQPLLALSASNLAMVRRTSRALALMTSSSGDASASLSSSCRKN